MAVIMPAPILPPKIKEFRFKCSNPVIQMHEPIVYEPSETLNVFMRKANTKASGKVAIPNVMTECTLSVLLGIEPSYIKRVFKYRKRSEEYDSRHCIGWSVSDVDSSDIIRITGWELTDDWIDWIRGFRSKSGKRDVDAGDLKYGVYQGLPLPIALSDSDYCLTITQVAFLLQDSVYTIRDVIAAINSGALPCDIYTYEDYSIRVCNISQIEYWLKGTHPEYVKHFRKLVDLFTFNVRTRYDPPVHPLHTPPAVKLNLRSKPPAPTKNKAQSKKSKAQLKFEAAWNAALPGPVEPFSTITTEDKSKETKYKVNKAKFDRPLAPCGAAEIQMCLEIEAELGSMLSLSDQSTMCQEFMGSGFKIRKEW